MKKLLCCLLAALVLAGCSSAPKENSNSTPEGQEARTVKVGVIGENNEYWQPIIDEMAKDNVTIEFVTFSDYAMVNKALAAGDIDIDSFQHYAYFDKDCEANGYDLTAIGETVLAPLSLYSKKITSIDEIQDGDKIAIASDVTNGGRAIKLLESLGYLEVDPSKGYTPSVTDITKYNVNIELIEIEANTIPSILPDVTAGFINGTIAIDSGLSPNKDSIFMETVQEGSDNPYINIIAARTADKDDAVYKKICELFQTDAVAQIINDQYDGALIPAWK